MRWMVGWLLVVAAVVQAADTPKMQIVPGKIIVPTDNMRRPWGELVSIDLKTRTGTFRSESTNEVIPFTVMPYAELLHHASLGDLQDFRVGERAIFRLHPNEQGEWRWLTYIQDEMNFLNGHKEYYWVDRIDAAAGKIECTDANADKSFVRENGIMLETDKETHYWKAGKSATFADIKVGDKLRTKTHGIGSGKVRRCWEVFLDDESLLKFQAEQQQVHRERLAKEGLPGYVDAAETLKVEVNLFPEGRDLLGQLKKGAKVRVAPAGIDRRPSCEPVAATVVEMKPSGRTQVCVLQLEAAAAKPFELHGLARVWTPEK